MSDDELISFFTGQRLVIESWENEKRIGELYARLLGLARKGAEANRVKPLTKREALAAKGKTTFK